MKLQDQAKQLWNEGSRRRVIVSKDGKQLAQAPLNFVVIGSLIAPMVAVLAGVVILATGGTVRIEVTDSGGPSVDSGAFPA